MSITPDPVKLAALEDDIAVRAAADEARRAERLAEVKRTGLSLAALHMREVRRRPDVAKREKLSVAARDKAYRLLAKNHADEFQTLVQEERKRIGLPPLQPRGARARRLAAAQHKEQEQHTPARPAPASTQAKCVHSEHPINKLPYGKFCGGCGLRIT